MPLPALGVAVPFVLKALGWAGIGVSSALSIGNTLYQYDQQKKRMEENEQYWEDYYENTGVTPLYPYRSNYYQDYVGNFLSASQGVVNMYNGVYNRFYNR